MSNGTEASAMNRAELHQLAEDRIRDARTLLAARRWSGAYYLAGYGVECALKACVIVHLMQTDEFPEKRFSERCWTHNLAQLLGLAGLEAAFEAALAADSRLELNWGIVRDWNESSRYERTSRKKALGLYNAIIDKKHGVLSWIKARW
jgi:HEPN domain-containing protein